MFDAQTITNEASLAATEVFTPWFPRGGDHAVFTLEVVAWSNNSGSNTLSLEIYHKTRDDSGDGALAGVSGTDLIQMAASGGATRTKRDWGSVAFKELVRFRLSYDAGSGAQWALYRILPPLWYDAVKA
jgi:hypothetical protein